VIPEIVSEAVDEADGGVESEASIEQNLRILNGLEGLEYGLQRRLVLLQRLKSCEVKAEYRQARHKACEELGISMRSLYRYIRQYREEGVEGIVRRERSDRGEAKVSEEWQRFIEKRYHEGNRGEQQTSIAQIATQVQSRAQELGETKYPSRASIYRILEAALAKRTQKEKSRAISWQGEDLKIITREGIELNIEYSNQVWQCDHTPADILVVDREGEILGRSCLTTVVDTSSHGVLWGFT
jgi:putative transposase